MQSAQEASMQATPGDQRAFGANGHGRGNVRVSFNLPSFAARLLRDLHADNPDTLRSVGVLSVEIDIGIRAKTSLFALPENVVADENDEADLASTSDWSAPRDGSCAALSQQHQLSAADGQTEPLDRCSLSSSPLGSNSPLLVGLLLQNSAGQSKSLDNANYLAAAQRPDVQMTVGNLLNSTDLHQFEPTVKRAREGADHSSAGAMEETCVSGGSSTSWQVPNDNGEDHMYKFGYSTEPPPADNDIANELLAVKLYRDATIDDAIMSVLRHFSVQYASDLAVDVSESWSSSSASSIAYADFGDCQRQQYPCNAKVSKPLKRSYVNVGRDQNAACSLSPTSSALILAQPTCTALSNVVNQDVVYGMGRPCYSEEGVTAPSIGSVASVGQQHGGVMVSPPQHAGMGGGHQATTIFPAQVDDLSFYSVRQSHSSDSISPQAGLLMTNGDGHGPLNTGFVVNCSPVRGHWSDHACSDVSAPISRPSDESSQCGDGCTSKGRCVYLASDFVVNSDHDYAPPRHDRVAMRPGPMPSSSFGHQAPANCCTLLENRGAQNRSCASFTEDASISRAANASTQSHPWNIVTDLSYERNVQSL